MSGARETRVWACARDAVPERARLGARELVTELLNSMLPTVSSQRLVNKCGHCLSMVNKCGAPDAPGAMCTRLSMAISVVISYPHPAAWQVSVVLTRLGPTVDLPIHVDTRMELHALLHPPIHGRYLPPCYPLVAVVQRPTHSRAHSPLGIVPLLIVGWPSARAPASHASCCLEFGGPWP